MATAEEGAGRAKARGERSLDRLVNFSDAVYAIAITLLALDIRLPSFDAVGSAPPLGPQLVNLLPNLFAFALSFIVIGGYWVGHHRIFNYVESYDTRMLWLNLLVLFFIVLLPFPTQVVAEYGNTTLGVEIYAGNMVLAGVSLILLTAYIYRAGLMAPEADYRATLLRSLVTPVVFGVSMVVAIWSPHVATMLWWLVAILHFVVDPLINSNWTRFTREDA